MFLSLSHFCHILIDLILLCISYLLIFSRGLEVENDLTFILLILRVYKVRLQIVRLLEIHQKSDVFWRARS